MNLTELLFILFALIIFVVPFTRRLFMKIPIIGLLLSSVAFAILIYTSLRWQMVALFILYLLSIIVFAFMNYNDNYKKFTISDSLFRIVGVIFISITLIINILFPFRDLKEFKSKYYVGTSTISITDYNRQNDNIKMGKFRNISLRMFYPSYKSGKDKQKLIDNPIAYSETMKRSYGKIISSLFNYVNEIETNSYYDVLPVHDKEFPLIIISHDWMEYPEYYYDLAEKISADGYYVAVVNYTGISPYTTLRDSNIEFGNTRLLSEKIAKDSYAKNVEKIASDINGDFHQVIEGIVKLAKIKENKFSKIDLDNIGVIGAGTSGRAALDTGQHLAVKAVIAHDPYLETNPSYFLKNKFEKESLILLSEEWLDSVNTRYLVQILENGSIKDKKLYYIKDFNHKDFTLRTFLSPLYRINGTTKASYNRSLDLRYNTTKAYFDYQLKGLNTKKHMSDQIESDEYIKRIMLR